MKADLHVHSTASDGTLTPTALVELAADHGVSVLAIADHDSVEGLDEARIAAAKHLITLVPAVELSTVGSDGRDVHILGYFVDSTDQRLLAHLAVLREARLNRAVSMVEALRSAGYSVEIDDVLELSAGGSVGRSHVARTLVAAGHATDVADAFKRLIGHGRPYYVAKDPCCSQQAMQVIRQAGGLPVIAHPGVTSADALPRELADAGLAGIEAYHAAHTKTQRDTYSALAHELGILATGGTDFHSPDGPNPPLGSVDVPEAAVMALLAAGRAQPRSADR